MVIEMMCRFLHFWLAPRSFLERRNHSTLHNLYSGFQRMQSDLTSNLKFAR